MTDKFIVKERHSLGGSHWYRFLPRKWQYYVSVIGIKLGLIRRYGRFQVVVHRANGKEETRIGYNILVDNGIKRIGDILAAVNSTDIDLGFMEPDSGTTTPAIGDTDSETPLTTADRLAATVQSRAASTPFEVVITTFINSTKYTRPQTINKLNVFFTPDETGDLFDSGLLASGIVLSGSDTATLTYGFIFR